jgi:effector-binding domain-containing protein
LIKAHAIFNYYFTLKIADKSKKQPKISVVVPNVWKYMHIAHNGSYLDDESQLTYLKTMELIIVVDNEFQFDSSVMS